jgi:hypothetical protein
LATTGICGVRAERRAPAFPSWLFLRYKYGTIVHMKKTLNIDEQLFEQAKAACGASTDTETVRLGLESLVRHAAYQRLRALIGTEPDAEDVPRRREPPAAKRQSA